MEKSNKKLRVGVISDTHGLVRPELKEKLNGVDHIIHAGDIGGIGTFRELENIAPVTAVCGNVDYDLSNEFPQYEFFELGGCRFLLLHNILRIDVDPVSIDCSCVIHGHTHEPELKKKQGIWCLNPGSAGPRRALLPVSMAIMTIEDGAIDANLIELNVV